MIALRSPLPDEPAGRNALEAELGLLRSLHTLLNEEAAVLATGASAESAPLMAALAQRRSLLTTSLEVAARTRVCALDQFAARRPQTVSTPAEGGPPPLAASAALRHTWNSVRAAYAHIARRQLAHARFIERQADYLQSRWNGLMHSAGTARVYTRSGNPAANPRTPGLLHASA